MEIILFIFTKKGQKQGRNLYNAAAQNDEHVTHTTKNQLKKTVHIKASF